MIAFKLRKVATATDLPVADRRKVARKELAKARFGSKVEECTRSSLGAEIRTFGYPRNTLRIANLARVVFDVALLSTGQLAWTGVDDGAAGLSVTTDDGSAGSKEETSESCEVPR